MANMMDYLDWRGDLTFAQDPFNEVDNLLMSLIAYVDLDWAAPGPGEGTASLGEVSDAFFALHTNQELRADKSFVRNAPYLMRKMAGTPRFAATKLRNYVNHIDTQKEIQFSALELVLEDGTSYAAYRGTDDTIVGWKEDFRLCNGVVPAEQEAADFLNFVGMQSTGPLRVGGHSKGGNLAIYAAVECRDEIRERITAVYNNDGPGFAGNLLDDGRLQQILPKVTRILPDSSVIGMLLEHKAPPIVIRSSQKGALQHDAFSWKVLGNSFVRANELSPASRAFDRLIKKWIGSMDVQERDTFIDEFFSVLEATGTETLTELQNGGLRSMTAMVKQMEKLNPKTKQQVEELLRLLLGHWTEFVRLPDTKERLRLNGNA